MLIDSQLAFCDFTFHELKDILSIDPCVSSTENPLPEGLDLILQQCRIMGLLLQNKQDVLHRIVLISAKLV